MKSNGALKPRQGASNQGSSPGVVLKKYRAKRYFKVNKNVVASLPLNACGIRDKNLTQSATNGNNICMKQAAASLTHQLENKRKCGENSCNRINNSFCSAQFTTTLKTKEHKYLTPSSIATTKKTKIPVNNCKIRPNTPTAAEMPAEEAIEKNYERKESVKVYSKQTEIINITTRRINDSKVNKKSKKSRINDISDEKESKQTVFKAALNTSKCHVIFNKSHINKYNNKLFSIRQINEKLIMKEIIPWFFVKLKVLLISMFLHAINYFNGSPFAQCTGGGRTCSKTVECCQRAHGMSNYYFAKMMRVLNMLRGSFKRICYKSAWGANPSMALCIVIYTATAILLPQPVVGDETDTFFPINGLETTTPEFDYASRGVKKFGDKCENTLECGFPGSICDPKKKSCQCTEDLPVTNHIDKCGKEAAVNESCFFNEQCEVKYFQTECRDQRCVCRFDMTPVWLKDGSVECKGRGDKKGPETYIDPAMIGVLIGMALMFIIICVVLRLFSQARWRENRTIFNTPNPRLMNVSLLRESKLLHGQERRGSRMSVRAPSRQPSMASLRPHSPNPSLGKTGSRSNSHGSNASATSLRSTRSNSVSPAGIVVAANNGHHERKGSTYQPHQHHHTQQQKHQPLQQQEQQHLMQPNIISNPVAETVTVEIIEPEK